MASLVLDSGEWTLVSDVTNYSSVGMSYIDLTDTSTWTKVDINSMVKSTTISGSNYNKIVMNAVTASVDNRFSGGSVCDAVRWHTPLYVTDTTGQNVRVTSTDVVVVTYKIERGSVTDDFGTNIVAGVCVDPTSTNLATMNGCGPSINHNAGAVPDYGLQMLKLRWCLLMPSAPMPCQFYLLVVCKLARRYLNLAMISTTKHIDLITLHKCLMVQTYFLWLVLAQTAIVLLFQKMKTPHLEYNIKQ